MSITYNFKGKIVVVTGASSGIGLETALSFSEAGCDGITLIGRDEDKLKKAASQCEDKGLSKEQILTISADLALPESPPKIIKEVIAKFGRIDILINNAGLCRSSTLESPHLLDQFDKFMNLNVRSVISLTQLAMPHLIETKGCIVSVSSICGKAVVPGMLVYNISKSALDHFTACAALELAPKGVRVNSVNPGTIITPMQFAFGRTLEEIHERGKTLHPIGRVGEVDDVAKAILFLASDEASFITGEMMMVDGGRKLLSAC